MSKLYNKYLSLKQLDASKFYLFKSGIFYIFLDDDAKIVSEKLGLKLTYLNENIFKCGFPVSKISSYIEKLNINKINFQIVDENLNSINESQKYVNDVNVTHIIDTIKKLDLNKISPIQSFSMLCDFQNMLTKN